MPNDEKRHALVLGSSGAVGKELVTRLNEEKVFTKIHMPLRNTQAFEKSKKCSPYPFDHFYYPQRMQDHMDDFFYCFGSTLRNAGTKELFRDLEISIAHRALVVAKQLKVKRFFLVSSKGSHPDSWTFYLKVKAEVEKILLDHKYQALFIYRPSLLLTHRKDFRFGEYMAQKTLSPLSPVLQSYFGRIAPVRTTQLADAILADARSTQEGVFIRENKQILELAGVH
jgi:uncharacterized protein YbjT (DUF2867 family)